MSAELTLTCPVCGRRSEFEQPPCADGHGSDCPELICVRCSTAVLVLVGVGTEHPARRRSRRGQAA
jgi:hypothetical protein